MKSLAAIISLLCVIGLGVEVYSSPVRGNVGGRDGQEEIDKPPYDAEVEWIESDGNQGIYTDIAIATNDDVLVIYENVTWLRDDGRFIQGLGASGFNYWGARNGFYEIGKITNIPIGIDDMVTWERRGQVTFITVNGQTEYVVRAGTQPKGKFAMFVITGGFLSGPVRMGRTTLFVNGILTGVFVPCRFTNENGETEGAMFDLLSWEFFRNSRTGAFAIGPDVE